MTDQEKTNGISTAALASIIREWKRIEDEKAKLRDQWKKCAARIKHCGEKVKNVVAVAKAFHADDEGDADLQNREAQMRMMERMGMQMPKVPMNESYPLFDELDPTKAFIDGARALMAGVSESECPHAENTPEGQEWLKGFREMEAKTGAGWLELDVEKESDADDGADDGDA